MGIKLLRIDAVAKFLKVEALGKALGCTGSTREKGSLPLVQGYGGCHLLEIPCFQAPKRKFRMKSSKNPNRMEKFVILEPLLAIDGESLKVK